MVEETKLDQAKIIDISSVNRNMNLIWPLRGLKQFLIVYSVGWLKQEPISGQHQMNRNTRTALIYCRGNDSKAQGD